MSTVEQNYDPRGEAKRLVAQAKQNVFSERNLSLQQAAIAQVHATLALTEAVDRLLGLLEDRL